MPSKVTAPTKMNGHLAEDNGTTVKFTASRGKIDDLKKYLPIGNGLGKFPEVKMEVQRHIHTLPDDQWGVIRCSKKDVTTKEVMDMQKAINKWLWKANLKWDFVWSPMGKFFMLVRQQQRQHIMGGTTNGTSSAQLKSKASRN